jgi:hypothetical protein
MELTLPRLGSSDARVIAEGVLGPEAEPDLVRRVAKLGGDTPLGVEEAARTLVASGDLIHDGRRFVWRVSPRAGHQSIPTEALIEERLLALDEHSRRMLEAVCIAPDGCPSPVLERVASADGLSQAEREECIERLRGESFLRVQPLLRPVSELLRSVVLESISRERSRELHGFLAEAMGSERMDRGDFGCATVGICRAEGGDGPRGARDLLVTGRSAVSSGFARSAVRLAAAAVQVDPSAETRSAASAVSRLASAEPRDARGGSRSAPAAPTPSRPAPPQHPGRPESPSLVRQTVTALLARDFDTVDRCIDMATAEGCDRGAAYRMRALAHLARGERAEAMRALAQMLEHAGDNGRHGVRGDVTRALVLLHSGDPAQAVRAALGALGTARRLRDEGGEAAALHTLAACYRTLGREGEAEGIEAASPR